MRAREEANRARKLMMMLGQQELDIVPHRVASGVLDVGASSEIGGCRRTWKAIESLEVF